MSEDQAGRDQDRDLADLLGRLRGVEPVAGSVDDALAGVRRRVVRHAARVRGAAAAVAVAAATALVVIPSVAVGPSHRTGLLAGPGLTASPASATPPPASPTTPSPKPTRSTPSPGTGGPSRGRPSRPATVVAAASAYDVLGCPSTWVRPGGGPWVPGSGSPASLIAGEPVRLLVCGYPTSTAGPRALSGDVSVHQGFAAMSSRLAGAPAGPLPRCRAGLDATDYLVRADYGDGSTSWVSVGRCRGATNGAFTSSIDLAPDLERTLAEQGSWGAPYPGDCARTAARPGIGESMVPDDSNDPPLLGYLCVDSAEPDQQAETVLSGASLADLVAQFNGLATAAGSSSCADAGGTTYVVVLVYAGGENVSVDVVPDCDSGVTNGDLVAASTDDLVSMLKALSTPSSG